MTTPAPTMGSGDLLGHHAEEVRRVTLAWQIAQRSPHTRRAYTRAVRLWCAWCDDHRIDPCAPDRASCAVWVAQMTAGDRLAPDTVRQRVAAVIGWLDELAHAGHGSSAGFAGIRLPRRHQPTLPSLTTDQVATMLDAARTLPGPHATVIALLATSGLRASETGTVGAGSLSPSPWGTVMTVTGKGDRQAILPVHPLALDAGHRHGWPADAAGIEDPAVRVRRWVRQSATIARVVLPDGSLPTPHTFRHWFITTALADGVPLHIVQDAARHADPATTRRYDDRARSVQSIAGVGDTLARHLTA